MLLSPVQMSLRPCLLKICLLCNELYYNVLLEQVTFAYSSIPNILPRYLYVSVKGVKQLTNLGRGKHLLHSKI